MNMQASALFDQGVMQVAPGIQRQEQSAGANVIGVVLDNRDIFAGLGDGRLVKLDADGVHTLASHETAVTAIGRLAGGSILSAGQDGKVLSTTADKAEVLFDSGGDWINALAISDDGKMVAVAVGKEVSVFAAGERIASFNDHPSTVSGLTFFKDGSRLAVSHYNGVSLWSLVDLAEPERLTWAGSVVSVGLSPDQRYLTCATQDREVHIWDLDTGRDFRLGGYQRKVKSIGWATDSSVCFTSGADVVVAWKMTGDPGAFPPVQIGYAYAHTVSAVPVVSDPSRIAAGFSDGSIQIGEVRGGTAKIARPNSGTEITAIDAPVDSSTIGYGTACGLLGTVDLG